MDDAPGAEWLASTEHLLLTARDTPRDAPSAEPPPEPDVHRTDTRSAPRGEARRAWRSRTIRWLMAAAGVGRVAWGGHVAQEWRSRPLAIAVGDITSVLPRDSSRGFSTLLGIELSRVEALDVIAAHAAAGDTVALQWLEDSVRVNGAVADDRYQHLYHSVHGLRLSAAHRYGEAVFSFREAATVGDDAYVRIYLELARALLAAGQPRDAIPPLRRGLKGPTSATGLHATRSELHELLGVAYEQAQLPDSALVHYARAVSAWRGADPEFTVRRSRFETHIAALSAHRPVRGTH